MPRVTGLKSGLIAPSILSADFSDLRAELAEIEKGGADWVHVDVMDGHFVPNLTMGPVVVEALKKRTRLPLDCHLMVARPEECVEPFAKAGADIITVHAEATPHLDRLMRRIRELGCKAGVSLNPGTPLSMIEEVLHLADLVLVMSVNPGFGGQKFIPGALSRIERLATSRGQLPYLIEVDGGVNAETIIDLRRAGADVFVAGAAIFGSSNREQAISKLRKAMSSSPKRSP